MFNSHTIARRAAVLPIKTMVRRKTMGQVLKEARLKLGMSMKDVVDKINEDFDTKIGETTIRLTELDEYENPGIKTVEMIAKAVELSPLDVIAMKLEEPPIAEGEAFKKSRIALLWEFYEPLPAARKHLYDEMIEMIRVRVRLPPSRRQHRQRPV